jgi:hypothetical protein
MLAHYGWPEDGLLDAETCSHPQQCILYNIGAVFD